MFWRKREQMRLLPQSPIALAIMSAVWATTGCSAPHCTLASQAQAVSGHLTSPGWIQSLPGERVPPTPLHGPVSEELPLSRFEFYRDPRGNVILICPEGLGNGMVPPHKALFFGISNTYRAQNVHTWTVSEGQWSVVFEYPALKGRKQGTIRRIDGTVTLACDGSEQQLRPASDDERRVLLDNAQFLRQRVYPSSLNRESHGEYLYIDIDSDGAHRVFAGREEDMRLIAAFEAGEVIKTDTALQKKQIFLFGGVMQLDEVTYAPGKDVFVASWESTQGDKVRLIPMPIRSNEDLIYRRFGIYESVASLCSTNE